jgi:hypothetical protein
VTAYDFAVTAVRLHLEELDAALELWEARDDSRAQPEVRRAASTAVDAIDAILRELHGIRAQLVGEVRKSDDAAAARADALLGVSPDDREFDHHGSGCDCSYCYYDPAEDGR